MKPVSLSLLATAFFLASISPARANAASPAAEKCTVQSEIRAGLAENGVQIQQFLKTYKSPAGNIFTYFLLTDNFTQCYVVTGHLAAEGKCDVECGPWQSYVY
ncbi:MAG: hypothetical protein ACXWQO_11920 [Bdellovibrionota bacterium]